MRYLYLNTSADLSIYQYQSATAISSAATGVPPVLFSIIEQAIRDRVSQFDQVCIV